MFRDPRAAARSGGARRAALTGATPPPGPSPAFARDAFEVGPSNQLAVRAADAVIAEPGTDATTRSSFTGRAAWARRTSLNAIGNELDRPERRRHAARRVRQRAAVHRRADRRAAGRQVERLARALPRGGRPRSSTTCSSWPARSGRRKSSSTSSTRCTPTGKQLVFASDVPPRQLDGLEERLRSRFEGGLVVEMQAPDRALREKLYARYLARRARRGSRPLICRILADRPASERARAHRHRASARRGRRHRGRRRSRSSSRAGSSSPLGAAVPARAGDVRQAADVVLPRRREDRVGAGPTSPAASIEELR